MSSSSVDWLGKAIMKIVPLLIILGFLFVAGAFPKIKSAFTDTEQFVNESFGLEAQQASVPSVPENQRQAILKLKEAMENIADPDHNYYRNCFETYYNTLPDFENTIITITYSDDTTRVLTESNGQIITDLTFSVNGIRPCVIANIPHAGNFYSRFLSPGAGEEDPYYVNVDHVVIKEEWGQNKISFYNERMEIVYHEDVSDTSENVPLYTKGYLFVPDDSNFCFFPATTYCAAPGSCSFLTFSNLHQIASNINERYSELNVRSCSGLNSNPRYYFELLQEYQSQSPPAEGLVAYAQSTIIPALVRLTDENYLASYYLGEIYERGLGVTINQETAKENYRQGCFRSSGGGSAGEQEALEGPFGDAISCIRLGRIYESERNYQDAVNVYGRACDLNNPYGCLNNAIIYSYGRYFNQLLGINEIDTTQTANGYYALACDKGIGDLEPPGLLCNGILREDAFRAYGYTLSASRID